MIKKAAMQEQADEAAAANKQLQGDEAAAPHDASAPMAVKGSDNEENNATTGMYTPRAASLQHRDHATGTDRSTHLSTSASHVVAFGSVRRSSVLNPTTGQNTNQSSTYLPVRNEEGEEAMTSSPRPTHQLGVTPRYGGLAGSMPMGRSYTRSGSRLGSSRRFAEQ